VVKNPPYLIAIQENGDYSEISSDSFIHSLKKIKEVEPNKDDWELDDVSECESVIVDRAPSKGIFEEEIKGYLRYVVKTVNKHSGVLNRQPLTV